jgi:hypothetical protein
MDAKQSVKFRDIDGPHVGCPGMATSTFLSPPVDGTLLERNRLLSRRDNRKLESNLNMTSVSFAVGIADHILRH